MAMKERLDDIEKRLEKIERALEVRTKSFLAQKYDWAINHKGTAFIWALMLCILGVWLRHYIEHKDDGFNNSVDSRIGFVLGRPGGVTDTLTKVQKDVDKVGTTLEDLKPFIQDVINHQFDSVSSLPTATIQNRLPAIQHLVKIAKDEGVKASPRALNALTEKLGAANTSVSGFWPVAADLLTYRSETLVDLKYLNQPGIPPCTDATQTSSPTPEEAIHSLRLDKNGNITPKVVPIHSGVYSNCIFTLDSTMEAANAPSWVKGTEAEPFTLTFRECHIVYHGGRISLLDMPDSHMRLLFVNCLFEFKFTNPPSPAGQKLTQQLLAQNSINPVFPIH
jgi:hypothetical protein